MQNIQNVLSLTTIEEAPSSPEINSASPTNGSPRSAPNRISDSSRRQLNYVGIFFPGKEKKDSFFHTNHDKMISGQSTCPENIRTTASRIDRW